MPVMTPFAATVTKSPGGGVVHLVGDPDQNVYPSAGQRVIVFDFDDFAGPLAAVGNVAEDAERWAKVQALLGPDVLDDIAAGRIVHLDPGCTVTGWITPAARADVDRALAAGCTHLNLSCRIDRPDHVYTVPLRSSPPPEPRTVRVPWAQAVEQQLTIAGYDPDGTDGVVRGADVSPTGGEVRLYDRWHTYLLVVTDEDGMVEVLDDGPGGVNALPTPNCARCRDSGEPCPYCWENPDDG